MKKTPRSLQSIIDNEAKWYAMYTIENRAIPNMIDGLKPVQRFFLYSTIMNAKNEFRKVAAIAGRVSEYGYHHGEGSAAEAGQLMANDWNNNLPIIQGRGNFGSRLVQKAAASRYTYAKLHDNFSQIYKDVEIAPEHSDPEHLPPAFYLPIIPMVLINGVKGIATGFATSILPHSVQSVAECVKSVIETGDCEEPEISFPAFDGKVVHKDDKLYIEGAYELRGQTTLHITDIPYKYDRESYIVVLDKLEANGDIVRYDDDCDKSGFNFTIKLRRGTKTDHESIMKMFALRQGISQNLTVIGVDGLKIYEKSSDLIKDFVEIRKRFIDDRIRYMIDKSKADVDYAVSRIKFIKAVINKEVVLSDIKKADLVKWCVDNIEECDESIAQKIVGLPMYSITLDEAARLAKIERDAQAEHKYWKNTTSKKEYSKDIKVLLDSLG